MEVFLIAAISADGFIGRSSTDRSLDWTSKVDTQFFIQKTREAGAIVMGRNTVLTVRHPMQSLHVYALTSDKERIASAAPVTITPISGPPAAVVAQAAADGHQALAVCGGKRVYTDFMQSGLVTKLYLTVEPILFGVGITLFDEPLTQTLHLEKTHHLSDQVVVHEYTVSTV